MSLPENSHKQVTTNLSGKKDSKGFHFTWRTGCLGCL